MLTLPAGSEQAWGRVIGELATVYGLRPLYQWPLASTGENCVVFEAPAARTPEDLSERLSRDRRVSLAQPVHLFRTLADAGGSGEPYNDPYAHLQHGVTALHLAPAHRLASGKGVKIALIDTGVDLAHPDLEGRVIRASNFVRFRTEAFTGDVHGTAVAGVLAAGSNNGLGIVGVAPEAALLVFKACWPDPPGSREALCSSYTLAQAVDAAVAEGAQVMNFSLIGPRDPILARLLDLALERGITVVAAATATEAEGFPASHPGVIAVLGMDLATENGGGDPPGSLSPGALPAGTLVAAPGVDVLTTVPQGAYDFFSGSSLAAAEVSGVVALLLEHRPDLPPAELAALLRATARGDAPGPRLVNACAALVRLLGKGSCPKG